MVTNEGGPYLQAALLCERVLQEKDGVLSIIRVIDRILVQVMGPQLPEQMPPAPVACYAVVMLKTGSFAGKYKLQLTPTTPSHKPLPSASIDVLLEGGEDRGQNVVMPLQFLAEEEGVYWFEIRLAEQILTKVPLRLIYQTLTQNPPTAL